MISDHRLYTEIETTESETNVHIIYAFNSIRRRMKRKMRFRRTNQPTQVYVLWLVDYDKEFRLEQLG